MQALAPELLPMLGGLIVALLTGILSVAWWGVRKIIQIQREHSVRLERIETRCGIYHGDHNRRASDHA